MVEAVIFDLDGVLADTHGLLREVNKPFFESLNIPVQELRKELHGLPFPEKIRRINQKFGKNVSVEQARAQTSKQLLTVIERAKPKKGAKELVNALKQQGVLLALATSAYREYAEKLLRTIGLQDVFDLVLTADDVHKQKPSPKIYLLISQKLNVRPEKCLVVDDSPHCLKAAKSVGMRTIGVLCGITTKEELGSIAEKVVDDLAELNADELTGHA